MAVYVTQNIVFLTISLAITLAIVCVFDVSLVVEAVGIDNGFSVELIHRESSKSPLYNPSKSTVNHLKRAKIFTPNAADQVPVLPVEEGAGEYLIQISIGTPPRKIWGFFDTGYSLVWTQCKPCTRCNQQRDPLFDPKASSTYKVVPNDSPQCKLVGGEDGFNDTICHYRVVYSEAARSNGILSLDTITLDSNSGPVSLPGSIFGCGIDNSADHINIKSSGRIGFGNKNYSLIGQLGSSAAGKFSYCLTNDYESTSKIHFGADAVVEGPGVVTTPLLPNPSSDYYYVTLEGISVGDERLNYTGFKDSSFGNIGIDVGSPITYVPHDVYRALVEKVSERIHLPKYKDSHLVDALCYTTAVILDAPVITLHFKGGADLKLSYLQTFNSYKQNVVCLSFSHRESLPMLGSDKQINFLVGFDLQAKTISFKPTDCTKQ